MLLGPNGAGKSTTLLTVSGLLPPIAGAIMAVGRDVGHSRRPELLARAGVSHVPENRAVFATLTVGRTSCSAANGRQAQQEASRFALDYFPAFEPLARPACRRAVRVASSRCWRWHAASVLRPSAVHDR